MSIYVNVQPVGSARGGVTIPRIWITIGLSILLHALLLWTVRPHLDKNENRGELQAEGSAPLRVEIAPAFRPPPAPPVQRPPPARPAEPRQSPRPRPAAPKAPPAPPPVIARNTPAPEMPRVQPQPQPQPQPKPAPDAAPAEDMAALLEARRRSRGEQSAAVPAPPAPPVAAAEDAKARAQRIAEANLGTHLKPKFGERLPGGGVFTMGHRSYDYAEFTFYGWNKDIRRNTGQLIKVRKGNEPDIRLAVVHSMISIIRQDYAEQDFTWESPRLGRVVKKSARLKDTAELESFLLLEFFEDDRRPMGRP